MAKKLRRSNLSVDAYDFVRDLFINGSRYNPGDKISVEELSRELGVSRTPLWGAINRLEAEGIVEIVPRQGVYLINFDPRRALEIYTVREVLEGMAARLAAEKVTDRQLATLRAKVEEQRAHSESGDVEGYYMAALEFHEQIARIADNKTLEHHLMAVLAQIRAMRLQHKYVPLNLKNSREDHTKLLRAIIARDPVAAEQEARSHIRELAAELSNATVTETARRLA